MKTLNATMDFIDAAVRASTMKTRRSFLDFVADRIVQAATEPTLFGFGERFIALLDAERSYVGRDTVAAFTCASSEPDAHAVLQWLRQYSSLAAMISSIKDVEEKKNALASIAISVEDVGEAGSVPARSGFDVTLTAKCISPLAHGGDSKAGNATIFRRMNVLTDNGRVLSLPYYSGNSVRGMVRDILADHFLSAIGLTPRRDKPPVELWFFHCLYAGGALEENSKAAASLDKLLGKNGALRTEGLRYFRDLLPGISLLGSALGNRIMNGRVQFADLRPRCVQWGTGDTDVGALMEWVFLTRRDDHEEHEEHSGMIANTECLKAGVILDGGVDIDMHATEVERSALALGLNLLSKKGYLGAESRRGLGKIDTTIEGADSTEAYETHLSDRKSEILKFLNDIGAVNAPS